MLIFLYLNLYLFNYVFLYIILSSLFIYFYFFFCFFFLFFVFFFFFSSRRRHTRFDCDWSSDVCSSDLTHWRRTIHGYTAYPPLLTGHLRRLAAQFPHPVALQAFARVGVDTVVVHHGRPLGSDLARRLRDTGGFETSRFETLLRRAGLDLFDGLPHAVAKGRIRREARFDGSVRPLYRSTADEVYRLSAVERRPGAPFPTGRRMRGSGWHYRAKGGDP